MTTKNAEKGKFGAEEVLHFRIGTSLALWDGKSSG